MPDLRDNRTLQLEHIPVVCFKRTGFEQTVIANAGGVLSSIPYDALGAGELQYRPGDASSMINLSMFSSLDCSLFQQVSLVQRRASHRRWSGRAVFRPKSCVSGSTKWTALDVG
jgi:hypothetical protein